MSASEGDPAVSLAALSERQQDCWCRHRHGGRPPELLLGHTEVFHEVGMPEGLKQRCDGGKAGERLRCGTATAVVHAERHESGQGDGLRRWGWAKRKGAGGQRRPYNLSGRRVEAECFHDVRPQRDPNWPCLGDQRNGGWAGLDANDAVREDGVAFERHRGGERGRTRGDATNCQGTPSHLDGCTSEGEVAGKAEA